MGRMLVDCATEHPEVEIAGEVDQGNDLESRLATADVVIDFSLHDATVPALTACLRHGVAMVIGTTGHTEAEKRDIHAGARQIPIVQAANFSTGVNTLFWLTRKAVEILGPEYNLEIVEMHHRHKQDAPSGTATRLAEILAQARGRRADELVRHGRQGICGPRLAEEIGMHALRGGDVVGEHTVVFAGDGERVELAHKAGSRSTFAHGALRAARWLVRQPPGLYSMEDVLGLPN